MVSLSPSLPVFLPSGFNKPLDRNTQNVAKGLSESINFRKSRPTDSYGSLEEAPLREGLGAEAGAVTLCTEEFGSPGSFRGKHLGRPGADLPGLENRQGWRQGVICLSSQEAMNSGPPEQWDWGQGGMSHSASAFSHGASKEIPSHCIYKASPYVSFLEHNVFNKKPLSLVKLSEI